MSHDSQLDKQPEGSALEALDSVINSHREGELNEWELQLVRRRLLAESADTSSSQTRSESGESFIGENDYREALLHFTSLRTDARGFVHDFSLACGIADALLDGRKAPNAASPAATATTDSPARVGLPLLYNLVSMWAQPKDEEWFKDMAELMRLADKLLYEQGYEVSPYVTNEYQIAADSANVRSASGHNEIAAPQRAVPAERPMPEHATAAAASSTPPASEREGAHLGPRGEKVMPQFLPPKRDWIEEELKDGDRICEAAGVERTEGGRLPVAKIINKLRSASPPTTVDTKSVVSSEQAEPLTQSAGASPTTTRADVDPEGALREAEALVRPYLQNGAAVFGVVPDHRFRDIDGLPMKLVAAISALIQRSGAGVNIERLRQLRDRLRKDADVVFALNKPAMLSVSEIIDECIRASAPSATPRADWIPIRERRPTEKCRTLIADHYGKVYESRWEHDPVTGTFQCDRPMLTHWMPLPAHPVDIRQQGDSHG